MNSSCSFHLQDCEWVTYPGWRMVTWVPQPPAFEGERCENRVAEMPLAEASREL